MSSLTSIEKQRISDLLDLGTGYVLNLTNATFAEFFREKLGINIYDEKWGYNGNSKGKRLRAFWEREDDRNVGIALEGLLDLWLYLNEDKPDSRRSKNYIYCTNTVHRLLGKPAKQEISEDEFLRKDFGEISFTELGLPEAVEVILKDRYTEALDCYQTNAALSAIFMCGSILEGLLLGTASSNPQKFNRARSCAKDKEGNTKNFHEWKLAELIDTAYEIGLLRLDVKKFSHALRDFRNYIHPYQQMASSFKPDKHTAGICLQVLKAAITGLQKQRS